LFLSRHWKPLARIFLIKLTIIPCGKGIEKQGEHMEVGFGICISSDPIWVGLEGEPLAPGNIIAPKIAYIRTLSLIKMYYYENSSFV
jgi:hypothetical protein